MTPLTIWPTQKLKLIVFQLNVEILSTAVNDEKIMISRTRGSETPPSGWPSTSLTI